MLKNFLAALALLYAAACFAAIDVNKANAAELDSIKGIGPALSGKILEERKKGSFKDWSDFIARVKGMGPGNAVKFSAQGMTIDAAPYVTEAAKPAASASKK